MSQCIVLRILKRHFQDNMTSYDSLKTNERNVSRTDRHTRKNFSITDDTYLTRASRCHHQRRLQLLVQSTLR